MPLDELSLLNLKLRECSWFQVRNGINKMRSTDVECLELRFEHLDQENMNIKVMYCVICKRLIN